MLFNRKFLMFKIAEIIFMQFSIYRVYLSRQVLICGTSPDLLIDNIVLIIAKISCLHPPVISFADHARLQRCHKHPTHGKGLTFAIKSSKKFYGKKTRKTDCVEGRLPSKRTMNILRRFETRQADDRKKMWRKQNALGTKDNYF